METHTWKGAELVRWSRFDLKILKTLPNLFNTTKPSCQAIHVGFCILNVSVWLISKVVLASSSQVQHHCSWIFRLRQACWLKEVQETAGGPFSPGYHPLFHWKLPHFPKLGSAIKCFIRNLICTASEILSKGSQNDPFYSNIFVYIFLNFFLP